MKFIKSIFLVLLITISVCACADDKGDVLKSNENTNESIYNDEELNKIINHTGTLEELILKYQSQYVKKFDNGYQVIYYGESSVAVIWFDANEEVATSNIFSCVRSKSEYDNLKIGDSLEKVQSLFPEGEYLFLHTGRNDFPRVSTHYTSDKFLISITYDENNFVTNIDVEEI